MSNTDIERDARLDVLVVVAHDGGVMGREGKGVKGEKRGVSVLLYVGTAR
jgi:ribosomal protein S3